MVGVRLTCSIAATAATTADAPQRGLLLLLLLAAVRVGGGGAGDGPALAVGAVELLDGVAVALDVAVARRRRRVDAALALLEAARRGLGCVCFEGEGGQVSEGSICIS